MNVLRALSLACVALCIQGCTSGGGSQPDQRRPDPVPPAPPTPDPLDYASLDVLAGVESRTLDNGMKLFVKRDSRLPVAAVVTVYRVGSVHEPEGTSGLAHFLEHMLFKGTDKYVKGEIDRITVRAGGTNNAFTENDFTLYWFHVGGRQALDEALQIEASRMRNSLLEASEFDAERKVVAEELYRLLDSPSGRLQYEIDQEVFRSHSYRRPGWGFENDLKTVKHEVMRDFYLKHYGPNNAAMIVVGDVDPAVVFERARELFGRISRVAEAEPPTPPEPPQQSERRRSIQTDKEGDRLGLAWRSARAGTDEDVTLDVIQMLLAQGKDSRLHKRLRIKDRTAYSVDAWNNARRYDGVFYVFAEVVEKSDPAQVEKAILEEVELLKTKPVGARELQKAKNILTASFIFGKETVQQLATSIGVVEGLAAPNHLREYLGRITAVTPEQVQRTAGAILRTENRTVALAKAKEDRAGARGAQSADGEFGEYHERRLPNGLTILVKPRRGLPIVSVVAYVDAGPLTEAADKAGVAELTGLLLDQGIAAPDGRKRNAEEIAASFEFTGAQLSTGATGVSIKALTRDTVLALDTLRDLVRYPAFPGDKFDLYRDEQLQAIRFAEDSPSDFTRELWYREVFTGHPLERPSRGLEKTVERLALADVKAHHGAFYRPDNTIIAVAGDVDPVEVMKEVASRFEDWKARPTTKPVLPDLQRQASAKSVIEYRKLKQINVALGHVSLPHTHPDYFPMRVFEQVFCSSPAFTDRLSRVVREDLHLAYEVWGSVTHLERCAAPFLVFAGTDARNGLQARDAALRVLGDLMKDGPEQAELEIAKGYLTRSLPLRWESSMDLARALVTYRRLGLGPDWPLRYRAAISAVTAEDVLRAARTHINPEGLTTVIVGPVGKDGKVVEEDK